MKAYIEFSICIIHVFISTKQEPSGDMYIHIENNNVIKNIFIVTIYKFIYTTLIICVFALTTDSSLVDKLTNKKQIIKKQ